MFSKHLLYLTSEQLCAYEWRGGRLGGGACFANNRDGIADFMDHLERQGRRAPVYLLADLIEEDFQRIGTPHVGGRAAPRLLQRRLSQQYRETPFRHHEVQGREPGGRRDDIVLLSALTNPGSVQPWVEALTQLQVPLAGLYSTTLLSRELLRKLGLRHAHLLLLTQQSAGWRQTYFQDGMLKFSRLTPAIDRDGQPVDLGAETARTQQFLTSVRLMGRGTVLHCVVVAPAADDATLDAQCQDGPETAFHFLTLASVAAAAGLQTDAGVAQERAAQLAEPLLLALLARRPPASHYTLGNWQRYYWLWRARVSLYAASAALVLGGAAWTGINLWQEHTASADAARLSIEEAQYDQRYRSVMAAMPPRVTSTANMRAAVTVERMLATQAATPLGMTTVVSEALESAPQIRLLQLDWKVSGAAPAAAEQEAAQAPISSLVAGIPARAPQTLALEAEVLGAQDDYRQAVDSMNRFAQALARHPRMTVEISKPPVDTRSSVRLAGKAGTQAAQQALPRFTLNLTWQP